MSAVDISHKAKAPRTPVATTSTVPNLLSSALISPLTTTHQALHSYYCSISTLRQGLYESVESYFCCCNATKPKEVYTVMCEMLQLLGLLVACLQALTALALLWLQGKGRKRKVQPGNVSQERKPAFRWKQVRQK